MTPLSDAELQQWLGAHPGWAVEGVMLVKTFDAATFLAGLEFVSKVGRACDAADHHPDIDVRWKRVTLRFVTHDAGNRITALDVKLATTCDALFP